LSTTNYFLSQSASFSIRHVWVILFIGYVSLHYFHDGYRSLNRYKSSIVRSKQHYRKFDALLIFNIVSTGYFLEPRQLSCWRHLQTSPEMTQLTARILTPRHNQVTWMTYDVVPSLKSLDYASNSRKRVSRKKVLKTNAFSHSNKLENYEILPIMGNPVGDV
jgi:hypothetical protein